MGTTKSILIGTGLGALVVAGYEIYEIANYKWAFNKDKSIIGFVPPSGVLVFSLTNPSDIEALVVGSGKIFANGVYLSDFAIDTYVKGRSTTDIMIDLTKVKLGISDLAILGSNPIAVRFTGIYSIALWGSAFLRKNNLTLDYTYNYKI